MLRPRVSADPVFETGAANLYLPAFQKWSARQDLHLRSPGPKPGMLLLHHALFAPAMFKEDAVVLFLVETENTVPGPRLRRRWRSRWDLHPHSSRRQRVAFLFSYESELVRSAGNAPVRHFRFCFVTPDLQAGNRITSRKW